MTDEDYKGNENKRDRLRYAAVEAKILKSHDEGRLFDELAQILTEEEKIELIAAGFKVSRGNYKAHALHFRYVALIFDVKDPKIISDVMSGIFSSINDFAKPEILKHAPRTGAHDIKDVLRIVQEEFNNSISEFTTKGPITDDALAYVIRRAREGGNSINDLISLGAYAGLYNLQGGYQQKSEAWKIKLIRHGEELVQAASATSF